MLVLVVGFLFKKYVTKFVRSILLKIGVILFNDTLSTSGKYISFLIFLSALHIAFFKNHIPIYTTSVHNYHKIFYTSFAFFVVVFIVSIISNIISKVINKSVLGINIIRIIVIFIGLMLILDQAGIKLSAIFTAFGIGSAVIGLALQDNLVNLFSGMIIGINKQIAKDDYIKLDSGHEGVVIEMNWRITMLRETMSNAIIIIPNRTLSSAIVTNFHLSKEGITSFVNCRVAYGSDLEHVEKVTKIAVHEIIDNNTNAVKTFTPIVRFVDFTDSSINFTVFFMVKNIHSKIFVQNEVFKNIYKKFKAEKIEIPFPHRLIMFKK
ncbi:MAG: mechanosensitive ion channel family protein [Endomicrobium sp.]|nr:mechanosensitive ion channel family protein [Endomicrobium sp.]